MKQMRQETLRRIISLVLLIVLTVVFTLTTDTFLSWDNITSMLREAAFIGLIAIGVTTCIITGGNNLSGGLAVGMCCMIFAHLYHYTAMSLIAIVLLSLLGGLLSGLFNGFVVAILQVPDFVATLSTGMIFQGITYVLAVRNQYGSITSEMIKNPTMAALGGRLPNGIYYVTIVWLILTVVMQIFLKKTKMGTYIYAMGANRKSAEYSGISFIKVKMVAFTIAGFMSFVAAMFTLGRNGTCDVNTGTALNLQAISAAVIGGAAFSGGRGDMIGTLIGVLFMQVLRNGVLKFNMTTAQQSIISGTIIVLMLVFDAYYNEFMQKRTTRAAALAREKENAGK
ncbi:MAG: ABC transporter permease [Erysipelotrichaceae bacterium]|nr:ABC transporter permease [Erysipelotrichaceae bacterium]MBR3168221.1 ABC transporter permease [Erysipelotrichaceae bacterium]